MNITRARTVIEKESFMDITPSATINQPPTPKSKSPQSAQPAISSDFETFIKMLTVQVQNQDPLNPMDSAEFATQLATFSAVEQQVLTNNLLTSLQGEFDALSQSQMTNWIGLQIEAPMPVIFTGEPVSMTLKPDSRADKADLVVRDEYDQEIQRVGVDPSVGNYLWLGVDEQGISFPAGTYTITTEFYDRNELVSTQNVHLLETVSGMTRQDGNLVLITESGNQIPPEQVTAIKQLPD
jgi:flagellar basal-body rod modification protein FlgD